MLALLIFRKAFDSVWHDGLLNKLLQLNVGGCFYSLIESLFSNSSCSIKIGQNQTKSFQYARGVRQAGILSPLLFNLYINDLPFSFQHTLSDSFVPPNGEKLNSRLYADDLIILSRSNSWMLSINPKKTKIMVFQKCARKCTECRFFINNQIIDVVRDHLYLGTRIFRKFYSDT